MGRKKEKIYRQMVRQTPKMQQLLSGAPEFLDYLKERGIPVNIATAAGYSNVRFYFDFFHLDRWFDFDTIVYDNGEMKSKPAPDYYLQSATKIDVDPKDTIVFEDSYSGLLAAKNAGVGKIIAIETEDNRDNLSSLKITNIVVKDYFAPEVKKLFNQIKVSHTVAKI
ncbi:HAD family hydrolase [Enterococcus faecium]|uniref:HAD family hydrolase n=1 Tax=Enterococcus faecium TaxID=1352 RepID=UPI00296AE808|nr:HAD family hydrolase [Enterococcus faecium]MDW3617006.1 HAD family hydrolase [Enterococcus faecium]